MNYLRTSLLISATFSGVAIGYASAEPQTSVGSANPSGSAGAQATPIVSGTHISAPVAVAPTSGSSRARPLTKFADAATPRNAATAADPAPAKSEEIVVTAQRRVQKESDVGISMAVLSGAQLRKLGVSTSTDIATFTPGVFLTGAVGGQSLQYAIRGVVQSDFNDAIESPIAAYLDDVYLPVAQGGALALFDINRVEILKGPQGTLFGRNATGGLVQTVINQPKLGDYGGYVNTSYGLYNEVKTEGAVNAPISDNAAVRLSGFYHHRDDFWNNDFPGDLPRGTPLNFGSPGATFGPKGEDTGKVDEWGGRFQLKWVPTDRLTVRLSVNAAGVAEPTPASVEQPTSPVFNSAGQIVNIIPTPAGDTRLAIGPNGSNYTNLSNLGFASLSPSAGGQRPVPGANWWGFPATNAQNLQFSQAFVRPENRTFSFLTGLHVDYQLDGATLTSISAYQHYSKNLMNTVDGSPVNFIDYGTLAHYDVFSEELRLAGKTDKLNWQTGVYYLHNDAWNVQDIKGPQGSLWASVFGAANTGIDADEKAELQTDSFSIFGQTEWRFAPQLTLVTGARLIYEHQDYKYSQFFAQNCGNYSICYQNVLPAYSSLEDTFDNSRWQHLWAGKLQLEYRPIEGLMVYAGVNRGTKAGSYNSKLTDGTPGYPPNDIPYKAEVLYNYEAGFKYANRTLTAELSGFYYDYHNYQAFLFTNLNGLVSNVPATIYGVDFNTGLNVTSDLRLTLGGVLLHGELPHYTIAAAIPNVAPAIVANVTPSYTPSSTITGGFNYNVPYAVEGGTVSLVGLVAYASDYFINTKNFAASREPSRTIADFNIGWQSNTSGLSASIYVKNAFDKRYSLISYDNTMINGSVQTSYGDPRTFGLNLGYKF